MASNITLNQLPPLPTYSLEPQPSLLPFMTDIQLALACPIISYWVVSLIFHIIDEYDLLPQYRLHTPVELLKRNRATKWDVFRDVIIQHIIQTAFGLAASYFDPEPVQGKDLYDIANWARRLRVAQRMIPSALAFVGLNAAELGKKLSSRSDVLSGVLSGGRYPQFDSIIVLDGVQVIQSGFAPWEINFAKLIYWVLVPMLQFAIASIILDTWQYFLHRGMHMNQWLYTAFHARHHRLYVPYAYGALYNHPVEGFLLDTLGTGVAYLTVGMTARQQMVFFTLASAKTVDDHCGYALPWDPLQHVSSNNAAYHDIHHQSWGIKSNFSQPLFTFWDTFFGTMWKGGDVKLRYERQRVAADQWWEQQKQLALQEQSQKDATIKSNRSTNGHASIPVTSTLTLPPATSGAELSHSQNLRRGPRKPTSGNQASLKGLKDRVSGSLPTGVPRVESNR